MQTANGNTVTGHAAKGGQASDQASKRTPGRHRSPHPDISGPRYPRERSHVRDESRAKSTGTTLANAPDGTRRDSQVREFRDVRRSDGCNLVRLRRIRLRRRSGARSKLGNLVRKPGEPGSGPESNLIRRRRTRFEHYERRAAPKDRNLVRLRRIRLRRKSRARSNSGTWFANPANQVPARSRI